MTLNLGRYSCPLCPERFFDLAKKKAHIHTVHGPKPSKKAKP